MKIYRKEASEKAKEINIQELFEVEVNRLLRVSWSKVPINLLFAVAIENIADDLRGNIPKQDPNYRDMRRW